MTYRNCYFELLPQNFVDGKMPGTKKVMKEVTVLVCKLCDAELEPEYPKYSCPACGETYVLHPVLEELQ